MQLDKLLKNINVIKKWNYKNVPVLSIHSDSRKVKDDSLFIAIKGQELDGNQFIEKAISNGAKVVVFEGNFKPENEKIIFIKVKDSRETISLLSKNFYNNPSSKITLIGVTGTNGKTTTVTSLFKIVKSLGYKSALLSTIENQINNKKFETKNTTPDPIYLNKFLDDSIKKSCKFAFMECSSHAIDQKRIYGLEFSGAIFSNLTQDHLDYHKTMKKYALAKKKFFDLLPKQSFALINNDDKYSNLMTKDTKARKYSFSIKNNSDFKAHIISQNLDGIKIKIKKNIIYSKLFGNYNVYNITSIYATCLLLGLPKEKVIKSIGKLYPPKGRLEFIKSKNNIFGIVDYAHTPDALLNILITLNDIKHKDSKIIIVFGCGGDRDKTKRSIMGNIGVKYSSITIVTSDNPRSEDPEKIIDDIVKNLPNDKYIRIVDRKKAIEKAVSMAKSGDVVLVSGKGHENYQIFKDKMVHFSDIEELKKCFKHNE